MKFISDIRTKHPEILELLHAGNKSEDVAIDDIFKGRIEGSKIGFSHYHAPVSYTHLRAHETVLDLLCRLLLEKKK